MIRRRRFASLLALASGLVLMAGSTTPALAAGERTSLSQSGDAATVESDHAVSAAVTDSAGNPVADGTKVSFSVDGPRGGVLVDDVYVGIAPTATGNGYWLLGIDGKVRNYGDAAALGAPTLAPEDAAVQIRPTPSGDGFFVVTSLGHVYPFGDAAFQGDVPSVLNGKRPPSPVVSMSVTPDGGGYHLLMENGSVLSFGNATFFG